MFPNSIMLFGHMEQHAALINPRWVQGYGSESMVGVVTRIAAKCMDGPYGDKLQANMLSKYRVGMHLLMSD